MSDHSGCFEVRQAINRFHALPEYPLTGLNVLDVGCGNGWAFGLSQFAQAASLHGVDVNRWSIYEGRSANPSAAFSVGSAECLPYDDDTFDVLISRVALPYTYIPQALKEASRVLRSRGRLFLSMHDWRHHLSFLRGASLKRAIDLTYVTGASLLLSATGMVLNKPWNGRYETFQTPRRMIRMLKKAGFFDVHYERWERHAIYQARRP